MNQLALHNNNKILSSLFYKMAFCYNYLENGENIFRARAYENAAKIINEMKEDISIYTNNIEKLDEIKGIGKSIAKKIIEFNNTGKISKLEQLQKKIPFEYNNIMNIKGFSTKSLHSLYQTINFKNRNELINKLENNKVPKIKGIGNRKLITLLKAIKENYIQKRIKLNEAQLIGSKLVNKIKYIKGIEKIEIAGSIRRKLATIGDIDIIIQCKKEDFKNIISDICKLPEIKYVQYKGNKKTSIILNENENEIQVDFQLAEKLNYGAALLYFTGPKQYNILMRKFAHSIGFKLNEYGIFNNKTNKRIGGKTEKEIFQLLNLKYLLPKDRKNENINLLFIKNSVLQ